MSLMDRIIRWSIVNRLFVVIAALATEEPVLLIGPHGTAKSLLSRIPTR